MTALPQQKPYTAEEAIRDHEKMVFRCANRFMRNGQAQQAGLTYEDLYQSGMAGLLNSLRIYREEAGVNFLTYAMPSIWREMVRACRKGQMLTVPINSTLRVDWNSLNAPLPGVAQGTEDMLIDFVQASGDDYATSDTLAAIEQTLSKQEMEVAQLKAEGYTFKQIGSMFGVTGSRIQQILKKSRYKLLANGIGWDRPQKSRR